MNNKQYLNFTKTFLNTLNKNEIMQYKNLYILGTSHIAKESTDKVRKLIESENPPKIVCLELDKDRLSSLISGEQRKPKLRYIFKIGFKAFLFATFAQWAQNKLGKSVGIKPGAEMKMAYELAQKNKIRIALIDQHIQTTLKRLSKCLNWKEKLRFVYDLITQPFSKKKIIKFDLRTVPSDKLIEEMMKEIKIHYPNFYRVLVEERNIFMANRLKLLIQKYPEDNILAVVGAGHVTEIVKLLES